MEPIIDFILDGELFSSRPWKIVPRVGEIVLLKNGEVWTEVTQVVWGDDSAAPPSSKRQWIQILCKQIEKPVQHPNAPAQATAKAAHDAGEN